MICNSDYVNDIVRACRFGYRVSKGAENECHVVLGKRIPGTLIVFMKATCLKKTAHHTVFHLSLNDARNTIFFTITGMTYCD